MAIDIYINCTKFPTILITPILTGKRYEPIKFNCQKENIEELRKILEKYSKKYRINYVLSEKQIDFLIKRNTKEKTIEAIIDTLEQEQQKSNTKL